MTTCNPPIRKEPRRRELPFDNAAKVGAVGDELRMSSLANRRNDYRRTGLRKKDLARDPFRQFCRWYPEAEEARLPEPNAMVLATATRGGRPSLRTVLLKGQELDGNARAALLFPWVKPERLSP